MRKLTLLPTWLLMRAVRPFLRAQHPFKQRNLTLTSWSEGATANCLMFGVTFWVGSFNALYATYILYTRIFAAH